MTTPERWTIAAALAVVALFAVFVRAQYTVDSGKISIQVPPPSIRFEIISCQDYPNQPCSLIRVTDEKGTLLLELHRDGTSKTGPAYKPDEVTREFWKALAGSYHAVCDGEKKQHP